MKPFLFCLRLSTLISHDPDYFSDNGGLESWSNSPLLFGVILGDFFKLRRLSQSGPEQFRPGN
jgi:hypothetical protein